MENSHNAAFSGGVTAQGNSLNAAVDRLDRALLALEARVRKSENGSLTSENTLYKTAEDNADYTHLVDELEATRLSQAELVTAAAEAHKALGAAAADIRQMLSDNEAA